MSLADQQGNPTIVRRLEQQQHLGIGGVTVRIVCSWCDRILKPGPPERVSHTICDACMRVLEEEVA